MKRGVHILGHGSIYRGITPVRLGLNRMRWVVKYVYRHTYIVVLWDHTYLVLTVYQVRRGISCSFMILNYIEF